MLIRTCLLLLPLIFTLTACSPRIDVNIGSGGSGPIVPAVVLSDPGAGDARIAMIDVRGLIADLRRPSLLGDGINPVDRFIVELQMAERDPKTKAVIVRITSPGGTVTASDILYQELRRFERVSGKPVVASLGEIAASGGYYLAVGADYVIAEPTCLTGSIGVIMPTVNFSAGLNKVGIVARSVKSGPNKDIANPVEPIRDSQYAILQGLVDEYYARFKNLVLERRHLDASVVSDATDGRVYSGVQAQAIGLVDATGGVRDAFAAAKRLAGIERASLVKYSSSGRPATTPYALTPTEPAAAASRGMTLTMNMGELLPGLTAGETGGFFYLWMPETP